MKKTAILQSNYIPWKGYFDLINSVDDFVIYDTCQYTKNDWRNRNVIKTSNGTTWLTIPVRQESLDQTIDETQISYNKWNIKHWKAIKQNYSKAKFFSVYSDTFEKLYITSTMTSLSEINVRFIKAINSILGINTKIHCSSDFILGGDKSGKLLDICKTLKADVYVSGPAARSYLSVERFNDASMSVEWFDYSNYEEYTQLYPPFDHYVTILDLIFNTGPDYKRYMASC